MVDRLGKTAWRSLFRLDRASALTLQAQIRASLIRAILDRRIAPDAPVPTTRALAALLGVGRNTALLAYRALVEEGYLEARARSGHVVSRRAFVDPTRAFAAPAEPRTAPPNWRRRLGRSIAALPHLTKPEAWQRYPYPFVYGQFDPSLFPTRAWRESAVLAMRGMASREWAGDQIDQDDAQLVEQIRSRLLPRRGIWVSPDEILVTLGAQQAMYLVATVIRGRATRVALEDPGYPDLRNLFELQGIARRFLPIDAQGAVPGPRLAGCDYVCLSPSHQNPTSTTMSLARRQAWLAESKRRDLVIIEDDYDSELSFTGEAMPSLRALDTSGRVIYVGSLSKTVAAGLRIGYLVAAPQFIREARAARRLMLRHPPANNQRAAALFLSLGHHEALIRRIVAQYRLRARALADAIERHLPGVTYRAPQGGSSVWLEAAGGADMRRVCELARRRGVLFDAGEVFHASRTPPLDRFRLGYSSIALERIEPGVRILGECITGAMA